MSWKRKLIVSYPFAFSALLMAMALISAWLYYKHPAGVLGPIFAGVLTGIIVALIQFIWSWIDGSSAEKLRLLGVNRVLPSRDNRGLYQDMIADAHREVIVLGVTATRFLEDFASVTSINNHSRVLLAALDRRVKVRILVATKKAQGDRGKHAAIDEAHARLQGIKEQFPQVFDYGFYSNEPAHSIVAVDDRWLVGPVFPGKKSKDLPATDVAASSPIAKAYSEYFEELWVVRGSNP